ncbi:MAG: hypothetical protein WCW31_01190 [Patescibacteria group bacterium]
MKRISKISYKLQVTSCKRGIPIFFVLSALVLFGLGCAKKELPKDQTAQGQEQPYLPKDLSDDKNSDAFKRSQLDLAVKNFHAAKSFKAKITKEDSKGTTTGNLEYIKPLRLRATLKTSDNQELGMVAIGSTVYIQADKTKWVIQNDLTAKSFAEEFFASMVSNDDSLLSFGVPADAPMRISYEEIAQCNLFKTKYKLSDALYDIGFCVNSKPEIQYVQMQTNDGQLKTEYSNYNDLLIIERPVLPLLEPKKPTEK